MQQGYKLVRKESPYKGLSVLIVDDFDSVLRALYKAFESLGFKHIYKAKDGKEALLRLENNTVDIIISDWKMPKMDGLELLGVIRKHKSYKHLPFVMLTGNLVQHDVVKAIEAGVSEYLIKPFSMATLSERVHKAFVSPIRSNITTKQDEQVELPIEDKKRTVLIVDDEPNNLQVLSGLLKDDYKVIASRSGASAIELCNKPEKPDLILLDIMMPEMDGLSVCKVLKDNPETEFIPIIFVTALSQNEDIVNGLNLGAVDYITKPIFPEVVKARVATHVQSVVQREKLIHQLDALVNSMRARDEFLHTFNHDMRNPLTAIESVLPELANEVNATDASQVVAENVQVMADMLNNQTLLQDVESGVFKEPLNSVNPVNVVRKVMMSLKASIQQKSLKLAIELSADHQYLGHELLSFIMLSNLAKNAVEAAPEASTITVKSQSAGELVRLTVTNLGEVPVHIQGKFFNKFITANKEDGTGIGAYSAKLCVSAQRGEIQLVSNDGIQTNLVMLFHKA
ncbi:response regulator [Shewanella maritima]|uniref:response regulator n=1 Tax=Shewanella maritima TaxID=2520507 RepID=UPI0037369180